MMAHLSFDICFSVSDARDVVANSLRLAYEGLEVLEHRLTLWLNCGYAISIYFKIMIFMFVIQDNGIDPPFVAWRCKPMTQKEPCDETSTFPMLR
nr:hypothetical protein [Tanacetum cinerariifolium]